VVEQGKKLRQGAMEEGIFDCGAMTMPRQIEIVEELVNDAIRFCHILHITTCFRYSR